MKKAVKLAKEGKCSIAFAALRDELRWFLRTHKDPKESKVYAEAKKQVSAACGSALGLSGWYKRKLGR